MTEKEKGKEREERTFPRKHRETERMIGRGRERKTGRGVW